MSNRQYLVALAGLLVLAAVVAAGFTGIRYVQLRAEEDARTSSLAAAREYAETMFGWTPENVSDHVNASMAVVTGEAKEQYQEHVIDSRMAESARDKQWYSTAVISEAGVISNTRETSKVLIFLQQTVGQVGKEVTGAARLSRLTYDMKYVGGKWLIANIDVITDSSVSDRLGIADESATEGAVPIPDQSGEGAESGAGAEPEQAPGG